MSNEIIVEYKRLTIRSIDQIVEYKVPIGYTYRGITFSSLDELYQMFPNLFYPFDKKTITEQIIPNIKNTFEYGECPHCYAKLVQSAIYCISCGRTV
jgi:hypothetical protein